MSKVITFEDVQAPAEDRKENGSKKLPPSEFWLNPGIMVGETFVPFPKGLALDGVEPEPVPNPTANNAEFRKLRLLQQQFHAAFKKAYSTMAPGETRMVAMVVQVRRVNARVEPSEAELAANPFEGEKAVKLFG